LFYLSALYFILCVLYICRVFMFVLLMLAYMWFSSINYLNFVLNISFFSTKQKPCSLLRCLWRKYARKERHTYNLRIALFCTGMTSYFCDVEQTSVCDSQTCFLSHLHLLVKNAKTANRNKHMFIIKQHAKSR
jgi:hypothetical protein